MKKRSSNEKCMQLPTLDSPTCNTCQSGADHSIPLSLTCQGHQHRLIELEETTGVWFQVETCFFPIDNLRMHVCWFCSLALELSGQPTWKVQIKVLAIQTFASISCSVINCKDHFSNTHEHCQARFVKTLFSLDHLLFWSRNLVSRLYFAGRSRSLFWAKSCTMPHTLFALQMCWKFLCLFWVSYTKVGK